MKTWRLLEVGALALAVLLPARAEALPGFEACADGEGAVSCPPALTVPVGRTWIIKASDNLCGLCDASQLSNPGVVDYAKLLAATPEMKRVQKDGIDPKSPEGVQLRTAAGDRIARAAESVRQDSGRCSIWKKIRHKDGRSVPDITDKVSAEL